MQELAFGLAMAKTTLVCMYEQPHDCRSAGHEKQQQKQRQRKGRSRQQNTRTDKIPRTRLFFFLVCFGIMTGGWVVYTTATLHYSALLRVLLSRDTDCEIAESTVHLSLLSVSGHLTYTTLPLTRYMYLSTYLPSYKRTHMYTHTIADSPGARSRYITISIEITAWTRLREMREEREEIQDR